MAKLSRIFFLDPLKKEERILFNFRRFLKKDGFIGFPQRCDNFDGHSMVSKIVIEFFCLGLTTFELQQFVYACVVLPKFFDTQRPHVLFIQKCFIFILRHSF